MSNRDKAVGEAVSALRGGLTQQTLADAMRKRGWKWSQATVWSIEKGERPLRLLEAQELADVLDAPLDALLKEPESVRADRRIIEAADEVTKFHERAAMYLRLMLGAKDELEDALEARVYMSPEAGARYEAAMVCTVESAVGNATAHYEREKQDFRSAQRENFPEALRDMADDYERHGES